jgi:hypothetical protein
MNIKSLVLPFLAALAFSLPLSAADKKKDHDHDHDHDHAHEKKMATPNGGRLLAAIEPHAEFFVTADRKVQITFLGEDGKAIAPAAQVVTVTAGDRSSPTKLTFTKSGNTLVSNAALPAGNDFPTVVQIKVTPDAKTVTEKFNLNLSKCPTCAFAEYACTCAH